MPRYQIIQSYGKPDMMNSIINLSLCIILNAKLFSKQTLLALPDIIYTIYHLISQTIDIIQFQSNCYHLILIAIKYHIILYHLILYHLILKSCQPRILLKILRSSKNVIASGKYHLILYCLILDHLILKSCCLVNVRDAECPLHPHIVDSLSN